jgi:hypothetical protein
MAADQQRTRVAGSAGNASLSSSNGDVPPHISGVASSAPRSVAEFYKLIQDGGGVTGGPMLFQPAAGPSKGTRLLKSGGTKDLHPREPLPCGIYTDDAQFEAEQGPFSRGLGNLEDFELTNAGAGSLCIVDGPENVDCTSSGNDPTGFFCAGPAVDAGDILTGIRIDSEPARGAGWWEGLITGTGFNGHPSKAFHYNYFNDTGTLDFLYTGAPAGCERLDPGPNTVGLDVWTFDGNGTVDIVLEMTDGSEVEHQLAGVNSGGIFIGFCCSTEIERLTWRDTAQAAGIDNLKWGTNVNPCPESFPPLTLDDIHESLEVLELKLDNFQCSGGDDGGKGSKCTFCESELDGIAAKNEGLANSFRAKLTAACQANARGQTGAAENILCATKSAIDAQDGKGLTPDDANTLRECVDDTASDEGLDLSDCS